MMKNYQLFKKSIFLVIFCTGSLAVCKGQPPQEPTPQAPVQAQTTHGRIFQFWNNTKNKCSQFLTNINTPRTASSEAITSINPGQIPGLFDRLVSGVKRQASRLCTSAGWSIVAIPATANWLDQQNIHRQLAAKIEKQEGIIPYADTSGLAKSAKKQNFDLTTMAVKTPAQKPSDNRPNELFLMDPMVEYSLKSPICSSGKRIIVSGMLAKTNPDQALALVVRQQKAIENDHHAANQAINAIASLVIFGFTQRITKRPTIKRSAMRIPLACASLCIGDIVAQTYFIWSNNRITQQAFAGKPELQKAYDAYNAQQAAQQNPPQVPETKK